MKFKELLLATIGYLLEYRVELSKALIIPFCILTSIDLFSSPTSFIFALFYWLFSIILQTIFAITTHRIILLGPSSVPEWGSLKWSKRESYFTLYIIGLALMVIPLALLSAIPIVGLIIAVPLICLVLVRFSLVFPAIAIEDSFSFRGAMEATREYQRLMFFSVILVPFLLGIPILIVSFVPFLSIVTSFLSAFTTVFTVVALSVSYTFICNDSEGN